MDNINLIINSLKGGGTEKVCTLLASSFSASGYNVNLYVLDDSGSSYHVHDQVKIIYLGKSSTLKSIPVLFNLIKNEKLGKILVFNHELCLVMLFIKYVLKKDIKIISRINNTLSKTMVFKSLKYRLIVGFLMRKFYNKLDFFIFQSNGIKEDMLKNFAVKRNYAVIHNPIVNISAKENIRKDIDLLYVGRLVEQKNVIDILTVIKRLSEKGVDCSLTIVGDGPKRSELEEFCTNNGLLHLVTFAGQQSNTADFYQRARVTLLTSFNEGFPNVLVESISYGTPVISYDCPSGPKDIIEDGVNGFLVEYLNINEFADKVEFSLKYPWDKKSIIKTSERFKLESIAKQYEQVIEQV
ncbi:glycosyltransferase [Vibrio cholerae]|uniref:glycosyltransferase n=1 Tax=Vibrio cholerae TaxID=666 RepID=UPI002934B1F5|nr:glycosyltransferase [Vibrio cholerae]MDV2315133.1 glycosyltransferase [Vibrio cholerae]